MTDDNERHELATRLRHLAAHPRALGNASFSDVINFGALQRGSYQDPVAPGWCA